MASLASWLQTQQETEICKLREQLAELTMSAADGEAVVEARQQPEAPALATSSLALLAPEPASPPTSILTAGSPMDIEVRI